MKLRRRYVSALLASLTLLTHAVAQSRGPAIHTVRDVELAYIGGTLVALVFQPEHGWQTLHVSPSGKLTPLCSLRGRSWFSWSREHTLTVLHGAISTVTVSDPVTCVERARIALPLPARDADAHVGAQRVAIAKREGDRLRLGLYTLDGDRVADLGLTANAELGFSADGSVLFNLDHGGGTTQAWDSATGAALRLPAFDHLDILFAKDGRSVWTTAPGRVRRHHWPMVQTNASLEVPVLSSEVLRSVSAAGHTLLLQAPNPMDPKMPTLRLLDLVRQHSRSLVSGHIDSTALNERGDDLAVAIRDPYRPVVRIFRWRQRGLFTP